MSIADYFTPDKGRVECVRGKRRGGVLEKGQVAEGEIAGGLQRDGGKRETYRSVEEYDPVLRAHCRLDETK